MAGNGRTRREALGLIAGSTASTMLPSAVDAQLAPVPPKGLPVDLALALAVDASGSVDRQRFDLQRQGYVDAFRDPQVLAAVRSGPNAAIAVAMYQWTGPALQALAVGWRRIDNRTTIEQFAAEIAVAPRALFGGGTSISGAIDYGVALLERCPYEAPRRVIDVSGDGSNNRGRPDTDARDAAVTRGININGLPILQLEPDLDEYFRHNVIGGPGAFVIAAETFATFAQAIRRKLILEISAVPPPRHV